MARFLSLMRIEIYTSVMLRENSLISCFFNTEFVLGGGINSKGQVGFSGQATPQQVLSEVSGARVHCHCYLVLSHCQPAVFDLLP